MRDCGLYCKDCGCDIEYTDQVFEDGYTRYENNYYCPRCLEHKNEDRVLREVDIINKEF